MDLVNALKSIFTRNTSAASTSGARVPILNSSGEPIGSDTMPNLASVLGVYQGITNVTVYTLQYNTPLNLTTGYTIVFLRHEYYRSMAIVSVGSASGLQILHEAHGGEAQGFYVGNEETTNGIRIQQSSQTPSELIITSFVNVSWETNMLKVSYIRFGG